MRSEAVEVLPSGEMTGVRYGTRENPWLSSEGDVIACTEKLKVLAENLAELRLLAQDALEDAVLMGCDETQFKAAMLQVIGGLSSGYTHAAAAGVAGRSS